LDNPSSSYGKKLCFYASQCISTAQRVIALRRASYQYRSQRNRVFAGFSKRPANFQQMYSKYTC